MKIFLTAPESILTPEPFHDQDQYPQLHPEFRSALYVCGGLVKKLAVEKILVLFVNVGDRQTVRVSYRLENLIDRLPELNQLRNQNRI